MYLLESRFVTVSNIWLKVPDSLLRFNSVIKQVPCFGFSLRLWAWVITILSSTQATEVQSTYTSCSFKRNLEKAW